MVFRSKVDTWLVLVLVAAAVAALVAAGVALRQVSGMALLAPIAVVAVSAPDLQQRASPASAGWEKNF
jgi:hypothetical protein